MIKFPPNLQKIVDELVRHVHEGSPAPKRVEDLMEWLEVDGWDYVLSAWDDEQIVLNLKDFAGYEFNDAALLLYEDPEGSITNKIRISYARDRIAYAFEDSDGDTCPSVHALKIEDSSTRNAVMGILVEIHGQGGPVPYYFGTFVDRDRFYKGLKTTGYLFRDDEESLTEEEILKLWETKSARNHELTIDQVAMILADKHLGDCVRSNLKDLNREDLLEKSVYDLSEIDLETLHDEVLEVWTEFSPVVREYVAKQDKGPYPIAIKGIEGAYFVVASEYPNSEPFDSLSDAENYVEKNYGRFLLD